MKRYLVFFLSLCGIKQAGQAQSLSESIVFEERVYNFGNIKEEKGKVSHTFLFKNTGKTAVTISDIHSGCGCIGKVMSKGAIAPGGKGQVTITFDPAYKSGFFSKEIVVLSQNGQQYNRIWVEGTITPAEHPIEDEYPYNFGDGLYLRLKVMAFGYLKPGETRKMELHYANNTDKEMVLSFSYDDNKGWLVFKNPGKIGPKAKGVISFSFTMPYFSNQDISYRVYPMVNNKKLPVSLDVKVLNESKSSPRVAATP